VPLGAVPQVSIRSAAGIDDMVRAMSAAVAVGMKGRDAAFADSLKSRLVHGIRQRDNRGEIQAVFDFFKTGGVLSGETICPGPVHRFDLVEAHKPGEVHVVGPGGVIHVHNRAGRELRLVHRAQQVVLRLPARAWRGLRYTSETVGLDSYQTLARSVELGVGDCDDHSVAHATLLKRLGFQVAFKVIAPTGKQWGHVYAMVGWPRRTTRSWLALDTTEARSFVGWDPADMLSEKTGREIPSRLYTGI